MQYIISKANCKLSNGQNYIINYDSAIASGENVSGDLEQFRENLKNRLDERLSIIDVHVEKILLTYETMDGRQ